jgi:hypothetical protein
LKKIVYNIHGFDTLSVIYEISDINAAAPPKAKDAPSGVPFALACGGFEHERVRAAYKNVPKVRF